MKWRFLSLLIGAAVMAVVPAFRANALSGSQFMPGRIIDDGVFYDSSSMSVQQIQSFLDSKVTCDRNGTKTSELGGGTRAQYGAAHNNPAPFTCLNGYYENETTFENNLDGRPIPNGAVSAAQIIHDAAQQYGVNPQVLIVLIQREQGLVTDEWPFDSQYASATGYACPDVGPNHSIVCQGYFGFYNQVISAAWQFKQYATYPNNYNFVPHQNNTIQWSPQPSCGTSTVYIENMATASLYDYAPYRPNQASLDNLYGTGDACSAYANRNFWRYFSDWFGSTLADAYDYQVVSQDMWQDDTRAVKLDGMWLAPRRDYFVELKVRNTGSVTWQLGGNRQVNLGTSRGNDRASWFCNKSTWNTNCNRVTTTTESTVNPGEVATFSFWITATEVTGTYNEYFNLVMDGVSWFHDRGTYWTWRVVPPDWQPLQQSAYTDSNKTTPVDTLSLLPGQRFYVEFKAKNTGTSIWQKGVPLHQMNIGTAHNRDRRSIFCDSSTWVNCNRAGSQTESVVNPGETGTFGFWATAPGTFGTYGEYFNLVIDGTSWATDPGMYWTLKVNQPDWQPVQQSAYTDSNKITPVDTNHLIPGQRAYMVIRAKNTGPATWQKGTAGRQVNIGTAWNQDRRSAFCDTSTWGPNCNRAGSQAESQVAPGQTGTFEFWITAPNPGVYNEYFNLVMDGTSWLNDQGLYWTYKVDPLAPQWQVTGQSAYTDSGKSTPVNPNALAPNTRYYLQITAKNVGNAPWQKGVANRQVNVGTSRPIDRHSAFCDTGTWGSDCNRAGTSAETTVDVGATGTFGFWITTPNQTGTYNEYFNLVMDGTSWLNDPGLYWTLKVQ